MMTLSMNSFVLTQRAAIKFILAFVSIVGTLIPMPLQVSRALLWDPQMFVSL